MPFLEESETQATGFAPQIAPPAPAREPGMGELAVAAFQRTNSIGSLATAAANSGAASEYDPSYDPFEKIKGYEDYAASFVDANNDADVARVKSSIDGERRRAELLEAGGARGVLAEVLAGVFDPINLIPIGGEAVLAGKAGYRVGYTALRLGRAGLLSTTGQEAILQTTQETRTLTESGTNIAAGTLLSGILGAGIGAVAGRDLNAMARKVMEESKIYATETGPRGSVGAAAADTTTLADETMAGALGAEKVLARTSPITGVLTSPAVGSRQIVQELADVPVAMAKNERRIASATSVESVIRQWQYPLAEALTDTDDLFVQYRLGRARGMGDVLKLSVRDLVAAPQDGKLTRTQFFEAVGHAMRNMDQHEIPEVAQAAASFRKRVFDPLKDRAIEAGILDPEVDVKTAPSYLMRVYDHEKILRNQDAFARRVASWYASEQVKKRAIQDSVSTLAEQRDVLQSDVKALEERIARREESLGKTEARQDEAQRFNKIAYKRSEKMSQNLDALRQRIRETEQKAAPQLEQLAQVSEQIKATRADLPEVRAADAALFKAIGASKKVREGKTILDDIEAASEYGDSLDEAIDAMKGLIKSAGEASDEARRMVPGAEVLVALEKQRAKLRSEIRPYLKDLKRLRGELSEDMARKKGPARGGAVFETAIRDRGNTLADQASGKKHAIEDLNAKLERKQKVLDQIRNDLEQHVMKWEGNTTKGAKKTLQRRIQEKDLYRPGDMPRLTEADAEIDSAVRGIQEAKLYQTDDDLLQLAYQTKDRILGTPIGRLQYDLRTPDPTGYIRSTDPMRGPLANRVFMIPDELIEDFLVSDINEVARIYTRSMAPDVEIASRFGRLDMADQFAKIQNEYINLQQQATSEAARADLKKRMDYDLSRIEAIRDRLRGTYKLPDNPRGLAVRVGKVVRDFNYLRLLGGMTLSAIPDMGHILMRHGVHIFGQGIAPMLREWKTFKLAAGEVRRSGTALDMVLDSRSMNIADVFDEYGRGSMLERGLHVGAQKFGLITLMAPWNAAMKQFSGVISQTRSLMAIEALAAGKATKKEITRLAKFGIAGDDAKVIGEQFAKHGKKGDGVWWANTEAWDVTPEAQRAALVYRSALSKEVDQIIATPGQEKPLWMSTEVGKIIGQFRSFTLSANQRILLSGLQNRDAATLSGAMLMVGLGMLSYHLKTSEEQRGKATTATYIKEGIDRSGITGMFFDINNIVEKATRGTIGVSRLTGTPVMSRYASRNAVDAVLGPTVGMLGTAFNVTGAAAVAGLGEKGFVQADLHAMRQMIPLQNLLGFKLLLDKAEQGLAGKLGIPKR